VHTRRPSANLRKKETDNAKRVLQKFNLSKSTIGGKETSECVWRVEKRRYSHKVDGGFPVCEKENVRRGESRLRRRKISPYQVGSGRTLDTRGAGSRVKTAKRGGVAPPPIQPLKHLVSLKKEKEGGKREGSRGTYQKMPLAWKKEGVFHPMSES